MKKLSLFLLLFALTSCGKKEDSNTLKVAATPVPQAIILKHVQPKLAEKGITLKIIEMDDYNLPNRALSEKEVDANYFQHVPFMDEQIKLFGYKIQCDAKIHLEPMALYSATLKDLKAVPEGASVAVPNDPTNEYRALALLEKEGLITLRAGVTLQATKLDIETNPKKLIVKEVDASILPRTLKDVEIAAIPTNYALQGGLNPKKDALAIESDDSPYANIIAIRDGEENEPRIKALHDILLTDEVRTFIEKRWDGAIIPILKECSKP